MRETVPLKLRAMPHEYSITVRVLYGGAVGLA